MVVAEKLLNEIRQLLSGSTLPPLNDLKIEFVKLSSIAEHWGTADVLRSIDARIKVMITIVWVFSSKYTDFYSKFYSFSTVLSNFYHYLSFRLYYFQNSLN